MLFTLSGRPDRRLRIRDLNHDILLTQPSVSRLVDRLAARGLVNKLHDPDDARGIVVELTDQGFELFRRAAVSHVRSINERVGSALNRTRCAPWSSCATSSGSRLPRTECCWPPDTTAIGRHPGWPDTVLASSAAP